MGFITPQAGGACVLLRGVKMKTRMILNLVLALTMISLFVSCAPSSSTDAQTYLADQQDQNIIGGVNSTAEYQKKNGVVGLMVVGEDSQANEVSFICTGSLIKQDVVITAAHCLTLPQGIKLTAAFVFFGVNLDTILNELQNNDLSHVRAFKKIIRHERYLQDDRSNHDIGLVRIDGTAPAGFQLAQLAPASMARTLRKGTALTLSGFGVSSYKNDHFTGEPVGSGDGLLRQVGGIKVLSLTATGEEITLDQSQGRGACHGDSGGPAYLVDSISKKTYVVGLTSRGEGLCDRTAIYTGVMGYSKWIADNLVKIKQ